MKVETREQVFEAIHCQYKNLRSLGVKRLGVFGSFVKGVQNENSDIDILVEFEAGKKSFDNFSRLVFLLEELFERDVDLVTAEAMSPYIGPRILEEVEYATLSS